MEPWNYSINVSKSVVEKVQGFIKEIYSFVIVFAIIYAIFEQLPQNVLQGIMRWYLGIFMVAISPLFFSKEMIKNYWQIVTLIIGVIISIAGCLIDINSIDVIEHHSGWLTRLLEIFLTFFLISLYKFYEMNKKAVNKKTIKRGIRKDLYYRTTNINLNASGIELIRICERFFDEYCRCSKKIGKVKSVEYVTLIGKYQEKWFSKCVAIVKKFIVITVAILVLILVINSSKKVYLDVIINISIIIAFLGNVYILKKRDKQYLNKIAIRYFYDEWGYCLFYEEECKYVGNVQMIDVWKYHRFIHSVLDIVALCRIVALNDKIDNTNKIKLVSSNFSQLFNIYGSEIQFGAQWIVLLPVWIAAFFEFEMYNKVDGMVKQSLRKTIVEESDWKYISIFIQGLWVDLKKLFPDENCNKLVNSFVDEIKKV